VTVTLWRVAADTANGTAEDMAGKGAAAKVAMESRRRARGLRVNVDLIGRVETRAHFGKGARLPWNRYLVRIDVPEDVWAARQIMFDRPRSAGMRFRGARVSFRGICLAEGEPDRIARRSLGNHLRGRQRVDQPRASRRETDKRDQGASFCLRSQSLIARAPRIDAEVPRSPIT